MSHRGYVEIFADRNMRLVFLGQILATSASRIFDIALVWVALGEAESYTTVGLLIFFRYIPYAVFGLLGGWLSDRWNRKTLILVSDLARAALLFALAGLMSTNLSTLFLLGAASFLLTLARTFFQPAIQGLLPQLAPANSLVNANAVLHGLNEIAGIAAPMIGGVLLAFVPTSGLFTLTGILFLAAAACAALLQYTHEKHSNRSSVGALRSDYRELTAVLLGPQRRVLTVIFANALGVLGVGGVLSLLLPAMVKARFDDGPETLGILMGLIALGTVGGAYVTAYVVEGRREGSMYLAWAAYGALLASFGFALPLSAALSLGLILGFVGAIADVMFATIVQTEMPGEHISKSFALFSTMANVGEALSAPFLGAILAAFGMEAAFAAGGGLALAVGLFGLVAIRSRRQTEESL